MSEPSIDPRSQRQTQILDVLWGKYIHDPDGTTSGSELDAVLDGSGMNRHVAPLRIKLRRQGWDIISNGRGYRLAPWKGARP